MYGTVYLMTRGVEAPRYEYIVKCISLILHQEPKLKSDNLQTAGCKLLDSTTYIPKQVVGSKLTHLDYVDVLIKIMSVPLRFVVGTLFWCFWFDLVAGVGSINWDKCGYVSYYVHIVGSRPCKCIRNYGASLIPIDTSNPSSQLGNQVHQNATCSFFLAYS